jgi:hypothetical protein|tara:strand:+ start:322 stop:495 length:174 start_codon:yes stop_codon:yes gene_type:complete
MEKRTLYRFLGFFLIALVVVVTGRYVIKLPMIIKVLALALNAITIYYAYNYLIKEKE